VCVIKLIGWKMDGWIGLSGCGKWMDVESGKWRGSGSHTCHFFVKISLAFHVWDDKAKRYGFTDFELTFLNYWNSLMNICSSGCLH